MSARNRTASGRPASVRAPAHTLPFGASSVVPRRGVVQAGDGRPSLPGRKATPGASRDAPISIRDVSTYIRADITADVPANPRDNVQRGRGFRRVSVHGGQPRRRPDVGGRQGLQLSSCPSVVAGTRDSVGNSAPRRSACEAVSHRLGPGPLGRHGSKRCGTVRGLAQGMPAAVQGKGQP